MDYAKLLGEVLKFAGKHQFTSIAVVALVCVTVINVAAHTRGKMPSWKTIHQRPREYGIYLALAASAISFVNHFLEASCK